MNYWKPSEKRLFGLVACEHKLTGELTVCSLRGEIWAQSNSKVGVVVRSGKKAVAIAEVLDKGGFKTFSKGDEHLFSADISLLPEIVKILALKSNRVAMAKRLNSN